MLSVWSHKHHVHIKSTSLQYICCTGNKAPKWKKLLVAKGTLAKDYWIGLSCVRLSTELQYHKTLGIWQMAFTASTNQTYTCIAFVRSIPILPICTGLFYRPSTWPPSKFPQAFSLWSWMPYEDKSCTQSTLWTVSTTSHQKEEDRPCPKSPS